jgi:hypothetical protein
MHGIVQDELPIVDAIKLILSPVLVAFLVIGIVIVPHPIVLVLTITILVVPSWIPRLSLKLGLQYPSLVSKVGS